MKKHSSRILRLIVFLSSITLIVFFIVFYILFRPFGYQHSFSVMFGDTDMPEQHNGLFFKSNALENQQVSVATENDTDRGRELLKTTADLLLESSIYPSDLNTLRFSLLFQKTNANLSLEIPCKSCLSPLRLPFYIHNIENYQKKQIQQKNPIFFYSKNPIIPKNEQSTTAEDWLVQNIALHTPIYITDEILSEINLRQLATPSLTYQEIDTTIPFTLYPNQVLYVQSSPSLHIQFTKKNTNDMRGDDALRIEVTDLNNKTVTSRIIRGDGISKGNNKYTEQSIDIHMNMPQEGVYKIHLLPQESDDFYMKNFTINTNKITFDTITVKDNTSLYSESSAPHSISVLPRTASISGMSIVHQNGRDVQIIPMTDLDKNFSKDISMQPGEYTLQTDNTITLSNGYFSATKETFFLPFRFDIRHGGTTEMLVTRLDLTQENTTQLRATNMFTHTELQHIRELEEGNQLPLQLQTSFTEDVPNMYPYIINNYQLLSSACDMQIFGVYIPDSENQTDVLCNDITDRFHLVKTTIPQREKVRFYESKLLPNNFYEVSAVDDWNSSLHTVQPNIRGDAEFALYTKQGLHLTIEKTDLNYRRGKDEVLIELLDSSETVLYSTTLDDDGNESNSKTTSKSVIHTIDLPNLNKGVYFLRAREISSGNRDKDFLITSISLNTNKFMLLQSGLFFYPTALYFTSPVTQEMLVETSTKMSDDIHMIIDNEERTLENNTFIVHTGTHQLKTPSLPVQLNNQHFAFTPDGFFTFEYYASGDTYIVTDIPSIPPFILYSLDVEYKK